MIINYSAWELALGMQIELIEIWKSFKSMLKKCKITKFYEINFKIFHRILATPMLISKIRKDPQLSKCLWCGGHANIDHLFLTCSASDEVYIVLKHIPIQLGSHSLPYPLFALLVHTIGWWAWGVWHTLGIHTSWLPQVPRVGVRYD